MKYLLRQGILWDDDPQKRRLCDILVENGSISQIEERILPDPDTQVEELEGAFVSNGWVDAHTHLAGQAGQLCLDANAVYPADGVTYVLDAGSSGPANYKRVHDKMARMPIRAKAYLNVARFGIGRAGGELCSPALLDEEAFCRTLAQYPEEILGVKIRLDPRVNGDIPATLARARKLADRLALPLIVHPSRCPLPLETVLGYLKENDVYAHTYAALAPYILDGDGKVKACVREARARGVWFDLAHGSANFSFAVARKALEQDFVVDTLSTDLHAGNITGPVRSMADTMSKMLYLGMPLSAIIRKVTRAPVRMLGLRDKPLGIAPGMRADLTAFRVEEGRFSLCDSHRVRVEADRRITPVLTVFGDRLFGPRHGAPLRMEGGCLLESEKNPE